LGSAQKLENGNYFFNAGWTPDKFSQDFEFAPDGTQVSHYQIETPQYRSFRMKDLYTP